MTITNEHEYYFIDKSTWGPGPWQEEPDKVQWTDSATGLPCLAVRHAIHGHWCGYVGVPESHPAFGLSYDAVERVAPEDDDGWRGFDVHGGLTFSDTCSEDEDAEEQGVCHIPQPGQPDKVYWLGFDAAHAWDLSPGRGAFLSDLGLTFKYHGEEYRTLPYIQSECASLARQLAGVAT